MQLGGKPPVLVVKTGNDLEACMLLLDEFWHQLAGRVPGQMLIAVPTRSVLLVTSAGSELGIQVVRETIVEAQRHEQTHSLSRHLYAWKDGRWTAWDNGPIE